MIPNIMVHMPNLRLCLLKWITNWVRVGIVAYHLGIPSYVRVIKYPGIIRSYHPENTPRSSRILRQLVCTDTCMGFNGISESFFRLRTPYEALYPRGIILFTMYYFTAINIFLSLHYTEILNSIIIPSIPYRTRQARSLSRRATQFWEKTNSQQTLTYMTIFCS